MARLIWIVGESLFVVGGLSAIYLICADLWMGRHILKNVFFPSDNSVKSENDGDNK